MCIALPGRVVEVRDEDGTPIAEVDFDGACRDVNLLFVPEARPGDLVFAHSGFAVRRVTPGDAAEAR